MQHPDESARSANGAAQTTAVGARAAESPSCAAKAADKGYYGSGFLFVLAAVFLALYVVPKLLSSGDSATTAPGSIAPEFHADYIVNGPGEAKTVALADLKGRVALLDFWATWCGPCRTEAPIINRLYARYKDNAEVAIVGINTDDQNLNFPMAFDGDGSASAAFQVQSLPTLVVLSRSGHVVARHSGTMSEANLDKLIQKALVAP
jgi:thiol-disulfide isomerase/thioredoxin